MGVTPPILAPGTRVGHYEIRQLIGRGGMGEVYRAHDSRLGRDVALKLLPQPLAANEAQRRRFEREARSVAGLNHPNIVTIHSVEEVNGLSFLTMELIDGKSLADLIPPAGLALTELLALAIPICEAVGTAHQRGITHRDLKPTNIMIAADGRVKVLDFGLAKAQEPSAHDDTRTMSAALTSEGHIIGTAAYMSPEQAEGKAVDPRSDVFSLGIVLFEMATGVRPFTGETSMSVLSAIIRAPAPALPDRRADLPFEFGQVIARCLNKEPDERYQTAAELGSALKAVPRIADQARVQPASAVADPASATVKGPERLPTLLRTRKTRQLVLAALAAIVAALIAVAFTARALRDREPAREESARPSIVLLPARVLGAGDIDFLSEAVPATLATYLAQVRELDTKVPPSLADVERVGSDMRRVAEAYGARHCLATTVTAEGERLVLNAQLIDPMTLRVTWSGEYQGRRDSYLQMARDAATGVQRELVPSVSGETTTSTVPEAELALRRGEFYLRRYRALSRPSDYGLAQEALEQALARDPKLAAAAERLAELSDSRSLTGQATGAELLADTERWARRAIELDPRLGPAWGMMVRAGLNRRIPDVAMLTEHALKGATFDPRCADCQNALGSVLTGSMVTLSGPAMFEARRVEPLNLTAANDVAMTLLALNRSAEALPVINEALRLEPESPWVNANKAFILADLGRVDEARPVVARAAVDLRERRISQSVYSGVQHAVAEMSGDIGTADEALRTLAELISNPATTWDSLNIQLITIPFLGRSGRIEKALDLLERGVAARTVVPYDWLATDARLERVRAHPRYAAVAAASRARFDEMRRILEAARGRHELPAYLEAPFKQLEAQFGPVQ